MFGNVFATLKMSACRPVPSAAASSEVRTKPESRETTVPAAMTALEPTTDGSPGAWGRSSAPVSLTALPAVLDQAAADPAQDHHDQQGTEGDQHEPDGLADLAGAQAERERGAELGPVGGHRGQRDPGDADRGRPGLEPQHRALAGGHLDRLGRGDRDVAGGRGGA